MPLSLAHAPACLFAGVMTAGAGSRTLDRECS